MQFPLGRRVAALAAALCILTPAAAIVPAHAVEGSQVVRAGSPKLEEDKEGWDDRYVFAMTKAVADSTMATGVKPLVMFFTIPVDFVLLPVTLIAGFF